MLKRILTCLSFAIFVVSMTSVAYASESEILLRMLLKKGIITQAEYNEVMGELKGTDSIAKRVENIEQKTNDLHKKTEEQTQWAQHVDKHITHAEGPALVDGLSIAAGITMVGQGTSGNDKNATGDDVIDGNLSTDLEISAQLGENGSAMIKLEAGNGTGLAEELDTYWGFNADAGPDTTIDITEAWYEHQFSEGMYTFTIGELNLTNYFDGNEIANDETTQFLSDGFVNDVTVEIPGGPGVRLTISPIEMLDISIAMQSPSWDDLDENNFLIAEADIKTDAGGRQGNYRLYVWTNRGNHTDANDATKTGENGSGFGISADQQILDFLTLFARFGTRSDDLTEYEFDTAWSGGVAISGNLWGRDDDVVGVAYGRAMLADHQKNTLRGNGTTPADEGHFEAYYSLALNEHVAITPDVQVITNAKGDDNFKTVTTGSIRGQFTF